MFKWDRLIRRNKINKSKYYKKFLEAQHDSNLHPENWQHKDEDSHKDKEDYEVVEIEILPTKIICPDCGGITLEGLDFCDKCGGEL